MSSTDVSWPLNNRVPTKLPRESIMIDLTILAPIAAFIAIGAMAWFQ